MELRLYFLVLLGLFFSLGFSQELGDTELLYEWVSVDYDWRSEEDRDEAIENGDYIVENNIITGVKVYQGEVYVTVSRYLLGVPSTMNKVIMVDDQPVLQPFPSWEMQEIGNCSCFQFTQSMEIVAERGEMWIIDVGRINTWRVPRNHCPAKIVILDMNTLEILHIHEFSHEVLSYNSNFVNDIVVDLQSEHAYMSDGGIGASNHRGGIIVFDRFGDKSHRLEHESMQIEPDGTDITINGVTYTFNVPSEGIALSPDASQLFYCALGAYHLYQVPTEIVRNPEIDMDPYVRDMGAKVSQTDGMGMGHKNLYFGALSMNAVYQWEYANDMDEQDLPLDEVAMVTQTEIAQDDVTMIWPDTFGFDDAGWLYYTPNMYNIFISGNMDFEGTESNFRVYKVFVDDKSYLEP